MHPDVSLRFVPDVTKEDSHEVCGAASVGLDVVIHEVNVSFITSCPENNLYKHNSLANPIYR